jgi:hypothetical protein
MFKALIKQIDAVADRHLPLAQPLDQKLAVWANLHGWNISDIEYQRFLVRQALFNTLIRQTIPAIAPQTFATPLDSLDVEAPRSLANAINETAQNSPTVVFNFWGEFYSALIPQSQRRYIGQFWTNELIAEWMAAWLLQSCPHNLADIGCGAGNFLLKAAQHLNKISHAPKLYGYDLSPVLLNAALAAFLTQPRDNSQVLPTLAVWNYLDTPLPTQVDAVICNPPYTRHHHIAPEVKDELQGFFKTRFHFDVSRQGTLAFYFLLKLIAEMPEGAQAAVIVPMEVLDARYGQAAKRALCQYTSLSSIIHFSPRMNAFHKVDVGASILLFRKGYIKKNPVRHLTLDALPTTDDLLACLETKHLNQRTLAFGSLTIEAQDDLLDVPKWFSIATPKPVNADWQSTGLVVPLKALAKVVRGIATGANEFFVLPTQKVKQRSLEPYVVRTLQRNREIRDVVLDEARWQALSEEGKSVWLLYLTGNDAERHAKLRAYLAEGEAEGYHRRSLVQTRKKWYAMEQRDVPAIFFTILTRGNPRFILNRAGVRPLNMFSLIYPNGYVLEAGATELLWALLNSSFSLSRLHSVSRTYGGNTLKVEPRELDNLPVINPLALPSRVKRQLKKLIDDFHCHQQSAVLIYQVNELVDDALAKGAASKDQPSLPMQLRLLETEKGYKATTDQLSRQRKRGGR